MARQLTEPFVFVFRSGARALAMDKRCVGQDYKVLWYLVSFLEWDNWLRVSQTGIACELGISKNAVWAAAPPVGGLRGA
jgi:hypothetical protein